MALPKNPAFRQALLCLTHPISLLAVTTLLLNALVWQRLWSSWVTGKIGDIAWLCFVPFLAAAMLAWLWPAHLRRVGGVACLFTGLMFTLVKIVPPVNTGIVEMLAVVGFPAKLALDPTDLLALPGLLVAWRVWQQHPRWQPAPARQWTVLILAALAVLADSPAPVDRGFNCLIEQGPTALYAIREIQSYNYIGDDFKRTAYYSNDGGLTWAEAPTFEVKYSNCQPVWPLPDPRDQKMLYLYAPTGGIYRTDDAGQTLHREITLAVVNDNYFDNTSGHLLIAAGREGIWVRTLDGEWRQTLKLPGN